jgi:Protein of unknown function (DUF4239)
MMYLTAKPLWIATLVLVGLPTAVAMLGPVFVRRRIGLDRLAINNEVAGFKFATIGVLYAVLLAFTVILVWERFSSAEADVAQEAGAAATIYRLANGMEPAHGAILRDSLTGYLDIVITQDWPAMEQGHGSRAATGALNTVYASAMAYTPADGRGTALFAEVLHQLDLMTHARRERLVLASGIVPGIIWLVLFVGAFLTIGFTLFFGAENLLAQTMMTGALSILIFSGLLVIVAIDRPFTGVVKVQPEAVHAVLADFGTPSPH